MARTIEREVNNFSKNTINNINDTFLAGSQPSIIIDEVPDIENYNTTKITEDKEWMRPQNKEVALSLNEFNRGGFISSERWDKTHNIWGKVLKIGSSIECECVIDKEEQIFQVRKFQEELFSHLPNLSIESLVLIKIRTKPGASRIDIYSGDGIVDRNIFDLQEGWKTLENSGLDKPFTGI